MHTSATLERRGLNNVFVESRGVAMFMVLLSGWAIYSSLRHASARFHIPHYLLVQHGPFGRASWAIDLFVYTGLMYLMFDLIRFSRDKVEVALFIGWIGPFAIDPARTLVPKYTSAIWWIELGLTLMFFLTSVVVFQRLTWRRSLSSTPKDSDQAT